MSKNEMQTVSDFIRILSVSKRIIVITGAGISVSCGIPDFRSKNIGIYETLDCVKIGIPSPELLFDKEYFEIDPLPFYRYAHVLLPDPHIKPSKCHHFLALLETKKKLMRLYTQNIDGLERKAGITKVIACHGTMDEFKCTSCNRKQKMDDSLACEMRQGRACYCSKCEGVLKPGITFFGEHVPSVFTKALEQDINKKCDLVIVIGTSLKVGGSVRELLENVDGNAKKVLINKEAVSLNSHRNGHTTTKTDGSSSSAPAAVEFDLILLGSCDEIVEYCCELLGWIIAEPSEPEAGEAAAAAAAATETQRVGRIRDAEDEESDGVFAGYDGLTDESDIVESKISTTGICVNVVQSDGAYSVTAIKRRRRGEEQRDKPASNLTVAIGTNAPHSHCSSNSSSSRNKSSSSSSSSIKTLAEGGDDAISVGQYRANNYHWSCDPIAPRTFQVSRLKSGFSGRVSGDASAPIAVTAVYDDLSDGPGPGPGPAIRAKAGRGRRGGGAHVGGLGRNTAVVAATASVYAAKSSATATRVSEKRGLSSAVIKAGRQLAAVPSPSTSPSPIILKKRGRPPLNPNHQQTPKDPYQHHNLQVKMQLQADSKKPARTRGYGAQDGRTITGTAPVTAPQAASDEPTEARPMVAQLPSRRAPKRASAAAASSMGGWGHLLKKQRGKNG